MFIFCTEVKGDNIHFFSSRLPNYVWQKSIKENKEKVDSKSSKCSIAQLSMIKCFQLTFILFISLTLKNFMLSSSKAYLKNQTARLKAFTVVSRSELFFKFDKNSVLKSILSSASIVEGMLGILSLVHTLIVGLVG